MLARSGRAHRPAAVLTEAISCIRFLGRLRIEIDSLLAGRCPELLTTGHPDFAVGVFDAFISPWYLRTLLETSRPEVIVVDPAVMVASFLLLEIVRGAGCRVDRVVVGSDQITDVMKVQAMRGGFFDLVDTSRPTEGVRHRLEAVHHVRSSLADDRLWATVAKPTAIGNLVLVPHDAIDVEILESVALGLMNDDIASVVHVAPQTVRNRMSGMLQRSGMSNRTEMAFTYLGQTMTMRMIQGMDRFRSRD